MNRSRIYSVGMPQATHTRRASCEEVDCEAQASGWLIPVDPATDLGRAQIAAIERSGRRYKTRREGDLVHYLFPPGEECFTDHRVSLDRPQFHFVTQQRRRRVEPNEWIDDFGGHLDTLRDQAG